MPAQRLHQSPAWVFFAWAAFVVAIAAMTTAVAYMPIPIWSRGFVGVAALMLVQSSVVLTKTLRDQAEEQLETEERSPRVPA